MVGASQSPLTKLQIATVLLSNSHCVAVVLKQWNIGSKSFIVLLLYFHKAWSISMDITEVQSKDALDFILALSCLSGFKDEHVGEATWFGLSQVYVALC